jgi:hypothetical protein
MSIVSDNLRRALQDPNARRNQIVAVYEMKATGGSLSESSWLQELAYFYEVVLGIADRSDEMRDLRVFGPRVWIFYEFLPPHTAFLDARQANERVSHAWEKVPWSLGTGICAGECVAFEGPNGLTELAGGPIERALALAEEASTGEVLVDAGLVDRLSADSSMSFGSPRRASARDLNAGLAYRELLWAGESQHKQKRPLRRTRRGTLVRWDAEQGRGLIITDDDARFYTDRRYLAVGSTPEQGLSMLFLDEDPVGGPDGNRLAAAALVLGDQLRGLVTSVDLIDGHAFIEVRDRAGFSQQLITARDVDLESLSVDATVEFFVGENARGATACAVRVLDALSPVLRGGQPAIAGIFLEALINQLRRQGASGAAATVMRHASLDWVPSDTPPKQRRKEVMALGKFAVDHWARRGVRAVGEGTLALHLLQEAEGPFNPVSAEQTIGAIRKHLRARPDYSTAGPNPITPQAVDSMLAEIQLGLRKLSSLDENTSGALSSSEALATQHFGFALFRAFRGGIVTSLPPEAQEALAALRAA